MQRFHFGTFLESVGQDVRYAARALGRSRSSTLAALLAIAIGIGSVTAVFTAVDRILFRSLPYPDDGRLVSFGVMAPLDSNEFVLSADWPEWRSVTGPFESITSFTPGSDACDLAGTAPLRLQCSRVEATFLHTFRIQPLFGRDFTSDEDRPNGPKVGIISYQLWKTQFGGAPDVVGRAMPLNGASTTVIGVLPPDFEMPNLARTDVLLPQAIPFVAHPNSGRPLRAFARLKPDITLEQARQALQPIFENSLQWIPPDFRKEITLRVRSLRDRQVQDVRVASWVLLAAVLAVLLIACANVGNLMLARGTARQREIAVRSAIGAGRGRLVRQALTESTVLASIGGIVGCGLAAVLLRIIIGVAPVGIPRLSQAAIDLRAGIVSFVLTLLSAILFGLLPALNLPSAERLNDRSVSNRQRVWGPALIAFQIAISLVLMSGAGLLLRTLRNIQNVPLGMNTESVVVAPILLPPYRYPTLRRQRAFFEDIESRLQNLPGLGVIAVSDSMPLGGTVSDVTGQAGTRSTLFAGMEVQGRSAEGSWTGGLVAWRQVTPNYFQALNIPIVRGRGFTEEDRNPDGQAIIISESLARRLFPNEDAIDKRLRTVPQGPFRTVVGIAANVKNNPELAGADDPEYYVVRKRDDSESVHPQAAVILRTSADTAAVAAAIRATVGQLDPALPVNVHTMSQRVSELSARPRFNAALTSWFAVAGVLLSAIGLYGVISFLVAQRVQEIGVRLALGATPANIVNLILSAAVHWTISGLLVGVAGSLLTTRLIRTLLFHVPERDPWTLAITMVLMLLVSLLTALLPSIRASRTDPMTALRND